MRYICLRRDVLAPAFAATERQRGCSTRTVGSRRSVAKPSLRFGGSSSNCYPGTRLASLEHLVLHRLKSSWGQGRRRARGGTRYKVRGKSLLTFRLLWPSRIKGLTTVGRRRKTRKGAALLCFDARIRGSCTRSGGNRHGYIGFGQTSVTFYLYGAVSIASYQNFRFGR